MKPELRSCEIYHFKPQEIIIKSHRYQGSDLMNDLIEYKVNQAN